MHDVGLYMLRAHRGSCTMLPASMLVEMIGEDESGVVRSVFAVAVGNHVHHARPGSIYTRWDWMGCFERALSLFKLPTRPEP